MTDKPIPYVELPELCSDCFNQVLRDATERPELGLVSAYCPHGRALVTAQLTDYEGERVVYCWSVSGPMTADQALYGLHSAADKMGAIAQHKRQD